MTRRKVWMVGSLLALTLFLARGVPAQSEASEGEVAPELSNLGEIAWEEPLARFLARDEPIYLPNSSSAATVFVPLSPRMEITSAVLHLEYTNSIALLEDRSVLRVSLGDTILAQLPLKRNQPSAVVDIRLPLSLLESGYNPLNFWVAQHYTLQCEDPSAPELWTQIDAHRSTVTFTGRWRRAEPTLAILEDLVDARLATDYGLTIVTGGEPRDQHLTWGALISQGVALRLRYQPLQVRHAQTLAPRPGQKPTDMVVVGTREEVAGLVGQAAVAGVEGAYLGVQTLPSDPTRFLLIVSGRDDDEVTRAVHAFAFMRLPLPDASSTLIAATEIPSWPDYSARYVVHQASKYPFFYFDYKTKTMQGISASALDLPMWVPPDFFTRESSMVEISLHFAYGAGLRRDSVLNIFLNGRFERVIHLRDENGEVFRDYKVYIPLRSFRAGANTLSFIPRMMPLITGECEAVQDQNLLLTIFEDSALSIPEASHYVNMPDLSLFARAGFPLAITRQGENAAVQVLGTDTDTIASAWMIMGRIAQVVSRPVFVSEITFSQPSHDRDILLVGPAELVPPELREAAPISAGTTGPNAHPTALRWIPEPRKQGLLGRIFGDRLRLGQPPIETTVVQVTHDGDLGRNVIALQYESPWESGRSIVAVLAATPERLRGGVSRAIDSGFWDSMTGDLAVWQDDPNSLKSFAVGPSYQVGDISPQARLEYYFSENPWFWTFLLILLMVFFALLTLLLLRRYRQKNLADIEERRAEDEWRIYEGEEALPGTEREIHHEVHHEVHHHHHEDDRDRDVDLRLRDAGSEPEPRRDEDDDDDRVRD